MRDSERPSQPNLGSLCGRSIESCAPTRSSTANPLLPLLSSTDRIQSSGPVFFTSLHIAPLLSTNWSTTYKFAFGQTKLGDQGVRKTDDKIDIESILTYKLDVYVNPYVAGTLKTQFAKGYQYGDDGSKTAVSQIFDPAYFTQSAGLKVSKYVTVKLNVQVIRDKTASEKNQVKETLTLGLSYSLL